MEHLARLRVPIQLFSSAKYEPLFKSLIFSLFSLIHTHTHNICRSWTHIHMRGMLVNAKISTSPPHFLLAIIFVLSILQVARDFGIKNHYGLNKRVEAVSNVRKLTKLDMKLNDALPHITVDPEAYTVTADGEVLTCTAATTVPLSRNYFLF